MMEGGEGRGHTEAVDKDEAVGGGVPPVVGGVDRERVEDALALRAVEREREVVVAAALCAEELSDTDVRRERSGQLTSARSTVRKRETRVAVTLFSGVLRQVQGWEKYTRERGRARTYGSVKDETLLAPWSGVSI